MRELRHRFLAAQRLGRTAAHRVDERRETLALLQDRCAVRAVTIRAEPAANALDGRLDRRALRPAHVWRHRHVVQERLRRIHARLELVKRDLALRALLRLKCNLVQALNRLDLVHAAQRAHRRERRRVQRHTHAARLERVGRVRLLMQVEERAQAARDLGVWLDREEGVVQHVRAERLVRHRHVYERADVLQLVLLGELRKRLGDVLEAHVEAHAVVARRQPRARLAQRKVLVVRDAGILLDVGLHALRAHRKERLAVELELVQ